METERKYKTGYKPKVCLINLSLRAWRQEGLGNIKDFTINITNIETISEHGRVNYKFDELIH